jgi:hypothetical protein
LNLEKSPLDFHVALKRPCLEMTLPLLARLIIYYAAKHDGISGQSSFVIHLHILKGFKFQNQSTF